MKKKLSTILTILLVVCITTTLPAYAEHEVHNTILITIDGVSRPFIYSLLKKNKMPGLSAIISRGNILNMQTGNHPSESLESYATLLSGYEEDLYYPENHHLFVKMPYELSMFFKLKKEYPNMTTGAILSMPQNLDQPVRLDDFFKTNLTFIDYYYTEEARKSEDIAPLCADFIKKAKQPFFLFLNITDPEYIGHRYREGCLEYSLAIQQSDHVISRIVSALKKQNIWSNTEIFVTTNYGFKKNTQKHQEQKNVWVASSTKMTRKGSHKDIAATIYELYRINWREFAPPLKAKALTY